MTEENQIENLMGYKEFQTGLLWVFGILVVHQFFSKNKDILNLDKL
ncbi:hypothetical protein SAMN05192588_1580 [Nonlabens sp. Hel1_33_55]|nr:hypothetical protein SAMN05192588_1580 [Nonlabens sp. Hel1_33_55]